MIYAWEIMNVMVLCTEEVRLSCWLRFELRLVYVMQYYKALFYKVIDSYKALLRLAS